ncbi:MAG: V-type ATPase subunit [Candidatus Methanomethyliales bacterium]|nr:V-type ATPase subunit [Candidatus Methanomethylicales archaeon]
MEEVSYAVVKAAARKGRLLSEQQILDLASSKDLKEITNKLKEDYPSLLTLSVPLNFEGFEKAMFEALHKEVEEFVEVLPKAGGILRLLEQEMEEGKASQELIEALMEKKEKEYKDIVSRLHQMGFDEEIKESERIFQKYGVPGLIVSAFTRCRLLKLRRFLKKCKEGVSDVLAEYIGLKVDEFNLTTIIRGIKNDIRRDALEELLIPEGRRFNYKLLREAAKAPDVKKAVVALGCGGFQEDLRALERELERDLRGVLTRAYYGGYTNLAAVIGYLELKKTEVMNIIRIANCISRGIEPRRIVSEFLF